MKSDHLDNTPPATRGRLIRWASWYDILNRFLFMGMENRFRQRAADLAGVTTGEVVLDVGCGTGNLTMVAKSRVGDTGEVHGIDAAPEMIQQARRKAVDRQADVNYQVGLVEDIPYPNHYFDVVLSSLMLHHLPVDLKQRGVAEIARVLKPGGRFVAVDFDLHGNLRVVQKAMQTAGFVQIERGGTMFWFIHSLTGKTSHLGEDGGARGFS